MNFYPLGPWALLNHILGESYKHHMVLAQYLYNDDMMPTDYFMYFRRRAALHDYSIILDNGVYEGQKVTYDFLLRATLELNPHAVILPDVPGDMTATLNGGEAFKVLLKQQGWKGRTMTVIHAQKGNLDQFCHSYMEACKQSPIVGFSRLTEDFGQGEDLCKRACFMNELKLRKLFDFKKRHHALGMRAGSLLELASLAEAGFDSVDSSAPIWRGLHGYDLTSEQTPKWPDYSFDPNALPFENSWKAKQNMVEVLSACSSK